MTSKTTRGVEAQAEATAPAVPKVRIIVSGSEDFTDYELFTTKMSKIKESHQDFKLVTSGLLGAPFMALMYAKAHNVEVEIKKPKWEAKGNTESGLPIAIANLNTNLLEGDVEMALFFMARSGVTWPKSQADLASKATEKLEKVYTVYSDAETVVVPELTEF